MIAKQLIIVWFWVINCTLCKIAIAAPDLALWTKGIHLQQGGRTPFAFPSKIIFVRKLQPSDGAHPLPMSWQGFDSYGFIKAAPLKSIEWSFRLNNLATWRTMGTNKYMATYVIFSHLGGVDTIVHAPENGEWSVFAWEGGQIKMVSSPFTYPELSNKNIYSWLFDSLGYNGVILDVKEEWLLVGSATGAFKAGDQATVYVGSQNSKFLSTSETKAAGIVECVIANGAYGVFKRVLFNGLPAIGQKVVIVSD